MSCAGWEVGDLALCVSEGLCRCGCTNPVSKGRIYCVSAVLTDPFEGTGLCFVEVPNAKNHEAFQSRNFRKIKPDAHEDCEPEFVTLLQRIKRPVTA